jgi:hypothetical protein
MSATSTSSSHKMTYTAKQYDSVCNDHMHLLRDYEELKSEYTKLNQAHEHLVWKHRGVMVCHANLVRAYDNLDTQMEETLDESAYAIMENRALNNKVIDLRKKRFDASTAFLTEKARAEYLQASNEKLKTTLNSLQSSSSSAAAVSKYDRALDMLDIGDKITRCWKLGGRKYEFMGRIARNECGHSYIVSSEGKGYKTVETWADAIQDKLVSSGTLKKRVKEHIGQKFVVDSADLKYGIGLLL